MVLLFVFFFNRKATYDVQNEKHENSAPGGDDDNNGAIKISNFRRFLPQIVASTVKNFLLLDLGLSIAFPGKQYHYNYTYVQSLNQSKSIWTSILKRPAIVIPALTGISNEYNQKELLSLTREQASWLGRSWFSSEHIEKWFGFWSILILFTGSIAFICQPIGSIASGWITDPIGRKKSMFIVNFPHLIAWFLMYKATEVWHIFVANVLLGKIKMLATHEIKSERPD